MGPGLFVINTALSPRANWTTLGPPLATAVARKGGYQLAEPGPLTVSSALQAVRSVARRSSFRRVVWMQLSARPEWPLLMEALGHRGSRRSAYVIDAWPYSLDKIGRVVRLLRIDPCFVAFREAHDELSRRFPDLNFVHLPFGVDTSVFREPPATQDKDIFAYWMGRRAPALHDAMQRYCATRGLTYLTTSGGEVSDPTELGRLVARSRYFLVTSPDVDHPERAGGFSPLVMRYLEGLAGNARLLGTIPKSKEFEAMLPTDAICEVRPDGSDLEDKLDADVVDGPDQVRMAEIGAVVRRDHSWEARAATMLAHLDPGYPISTSTSA